MNLMRQARAAVRLPDPAERREIRLRAAIGMKSMAAELGVGVMTLYRWEQGLTSPRDENLIRYSELLDVLRREVGAA